MLLSETSKCSYNKIAHNTTCLNLIIFYSAGHSERRKHKSFYLKICSLWWEFLLKVSLFLGINGYLLSIDNKVLQTWKKSLRVKIQQERVHVSQSETHKPANDKAKFKQSMQCCSQWGPTSTSRLWNVERSMIKTAEQALWRASQASHHISTRTRTVSLTVHKAFICFPPVSTDWHRNMSHLPSGSKLNEIRKISKHKTTRNIWTERQIRHQIILLYINKTMSAKKHFCNHPNNRYVHHTVSIKTLGNCKF